MFDTTIMRRQEAGGRMALKPVRGLPEFGAMHPTDGGTDLSLLTLINPQKTRNKCLAVDAPNQPTHDATHGKTILSVEAFLERLFSGKIDLDASTRALSEFTHRYPPKTLRDPPFRKKTALPQRLSLRHAATHAAHRSYHSGRKQA